MYKKIIDRIKLCNYHFTQHKFKNRRALKTMSYTTAIFVMPSLSALKIKRDYVSMPEC